MEFQEKGQDHMLMLRQRAEDALRGKQIEVGGLSSEDIQYLLHELQVHQAELSIQNEELRRIQVELETSRDMYADLYNFAPAGYCTITHKDQIIEANQTLSELLGYLPRELAFHKLSDFVVPHDQDKYFLFRERSFARYGQQSTEIRMVKNTGENLYVRLESMLSQEDENRLMVMVIDISSQRELQFRIIEQREKERQQIAHDLHDGPVQMLSAINFNLRGLIIDNNDPKLIKALEDIQNSLREQIQVLRSYAVELRSPILSQLGLEIALRSYIEGYGERNPGIVIRTSLRSIGNMISETAALALYRICQEALQNVAKHAQVPAIQVTVRLDTDKYQARLEVEDNGPGFELPDNWFLMAQSGHLGLIGMRERAEATGGRMEIATGRGKGTRIRALVPLEMRSSTKQID